MITAKDVTREIVPIKIGVRTAVVLCKEKSRIVMSAMKIAEKGCYPKSSRMDLRCLQSNMG